jgi:hypothetical protein
MKAKLSSRQSKENLETKTTFSIDYQKHSPTPATFNESKNQSLLSQSCPKVPPLRIDAIKQHLES